MVEPRNIVFFDGECGFCTRSVQALLKMDKKEILFFAPLQGSTAQRYLSSADTLRRLATLGIVSLKDSSSLIFVEQLEDNTFALSVRSKAVFRILWLLGGKWKLFGWLFLLPAFFWDGIYRQIAKHRKGIWKKVCKLPSPGQSRRFLP